MNKNKKTLIMGIIFITVVVLSVVGLTYAFFTAEVFGNDNASSTIVKTGDLKLVFTDTDTIEINGALPGSSAEKTFTVENTGTHAVEYTIVIEDLVNTFVGGELVYSLTNDAGLNIEEEKMPTEEDNNELETTAISPGIVHTYTIRVTFKETGSNQNHNQGAIFGGKLQIKTEETYAASNGLGVVAIYVDNKRVNKLDENKYYAIDEETSYCENGEEIEWDVYTRKMSVIPINQDTQCRLYLKDVTKLSDLIISLETAQSDETLNFEYASNGVYGCTYTNGWTGCKTDTTKITKGLYYTNDLTKTEDIDGDGEGEVVYYYRGEVENNYVIFGGYCWRIVRTLEDGGVRLRYGGTPSGGACPKTGTAVHTESNVKYNNAQNNAKYVGYTYDNGGVQEDSNIKTRVESWYETNIWKNGENKKVIDLIKDAVYCNDRTESTTPNYFGASERLFHSKTAKNPTYVCAREEDKYTQSEENGNGLLKYPAGLLTADEMVYAGVRHGSNNLTYYLYTDETYWTMSPYIFDGTHAFAWHTAAGMHSSYYVSSAFAVVPVISLVEEAKVSSGTGEYDSPYVIKTN